MKNPWAFKNGSGDEVQTCDAESRMEIVRKETNHNRLRAIMDWPETQRTVVKAAERRLRKVIGL